MSGFSVSNQTKIRSGLLEFVDSSHVTKADDLKSESLNARVHLAGSQYCINENSHSNSMMNSLFKLFIQNLELFDQMNIALDSLGIFGDELPEAFAHEWGVSKVDDKETMEIHDCFQNHRINANPMRTAIRG